MTNIKVFALGGLGEVGKNLYCIEIDEELFIIDCGIMFPDMGYGISYIVNDLTYLKSNREKIKAIFITHGHEDHIGGLTYLIKELGEIRIYASGIAQSFILNKFMEYPLLPLDLRSYNANTVLKYESCVISFFNTTHSIPDSFGIALKTELGYILHTGDFKFDLSPIGEGTDFSKIISYSKEGVLLLLSDSTNSLVNKMSPSEKVIGENILRLFNRINGRIIISTFSSNVYRVAQIVTAAKLTNRRVIVFGRSMEKNVEAAKALGYINDSDDVFIGIDEYPHIDKKKIVVICTGSQGEPMSALSRMADGTHRNIKVSEGDTIIFSSSVIPGNSAGIDNIVNKLFKIGANVIVNSPLLDTHTSGHASSEELKLMLDLVKPKYFMPIHGEYAMLKAHALIAKAIGICEENIFVLENGEVLAISDNDVTVDQKVESDNVFIDDGKIITGSIIKERRMLSEVGAVLISLIKKENGEVLEPSIEVVGFNIPRNQKGIMNGLKIRAKERLASYIEKTKTYSKTYIEAQINNMAQKYLEDLIGRKPLVLTTILDVK